MSSKSPSFVSTLPVTLDGSGNFSIAPAQVDGATSFLVIAISAFDANGIHRVLDTREAWYNPYISQVSNPVAINGHVKLAVDGDDNDNSVADTSLLATGTDYDFSLLSGICGGVTSVFLTLQVYA